MNTIQGIKKIYGLDTIAFAEVKNEKDEPTGWAKHWDNDQRLSIIIPLAVHAELAKDPTNFAMAHREEMKQPKDAQGNPDQSKEAYKLVTLFVPTNSNIIGTY